MKENGKCRLLMGAYYMLICIMLSYAAYYLGKKGFSPWETGLIVSGSCAAGSLLQAAAGVIADRDPRWFWKRQLVAYSVIGLAVSAARFMLKGHVMEGVSYGLLIMITLVMMPLVNSACFYYIDRGVGVDFGVARGTGSVAYAAASLVLGRLTSSGGPGVLLTACAAGFALMLTSSLMMPEAGAPLTAPVKKEKGRHKGFAAKYPVFMLMAAGICLAMIFHNIVTTYLISIVENAGGGPDSMGVALAIAGAVELPIMFFYTRISEKTGLTSAVLIVAACIFFTVRGGMFVAASGVLMIYFIQLFQSVSYGLVAAAKATYAHETVAVDDDTTGQAVMSMTETIGMVAGSFLGGLLLSKGGTEYMLWAGTALAAAGTIVTAIAARAGRAGGRKDEQ